MKVKAQLCIVSIIKGITFDSFFGFGLKDRVMSPLLLLHNFLTVASQKSAVLDLNVSLLVKGFHDANK